MEQLLLLAPARLPTLRLFRRQVMAVLHGDRFTKVGIKGQADLYGIERGSRHVEIELKGVNTPLTPEQKAWKAFCEAWGVVYMLLRMQPGESPEQAAQRWVGEISERMSISERQIPI